MKTIITTCREYVEHLRDAMAEFNPESNAKVFPEFVLAHARQWTAAPLPEKYHRGEPKNCFCNATRLALGNMDLTYVEGYASKFFPLMHAWCVTSSGEVIDNTWEGPEGCDYFGIPFNTHFLIKQLRKNRYYGLLDNGRGVGDVVIKKIPARTFLAPRWLKELTDS